MSDARWDTLPCGRDPRPLLDLVADRSPLDPAAHEANCPYCQAALTELAQLWEPVRDWVDRPVQLPQRLLATVAARVRRLAQSPRHIAISTAQGATLVTSWVLGLIATAAAQATPGVDKITVPLSSAFGRSARREAVRYGADGVDIDEAGADAIAVTLGVTAQGGENLHLVADRVRQNVMSAITSQTSIPVTRVDVAIDDVAFLGGKPTRE